MIGSELSAWRSKRVAEMHIARPAATSSMAISRSLTENLGMPSIVLRPRLLYCGDEVSQAANRVVGGVGTARDVAVCAVGAELLVVRPIDLWSANPGRVNLLLRSHPCLNRSQYG